MIDQTIGLTEKDLDKKIYRIFNKKRFYEIFDNNELVLVRPKRWEDPFENFLMNCTYKDNQGNLFGIGFRENYYGQCWTEQVESDAMWRIYAEKKDGFKVQTTIRKLYEALFSQLKGLPTLTTFIGRVSYLKKKQIQDLLNDPVKIKELITSQSGKGIAETLLFKKKPFKHEKEIRIIHGVSERRESDFFKFKVNPNKLFDAITIDPRMKYDDFRANKNKIKTYGFNKSIIQSKLYRVKFQIIKIDL